MAYTTVLFMCKEDLGGDSVQEFVCHKDNYLLQALVAQCAAMCEPLTTSCGQGPRDSGTGAARAGRAPGVGALRLPLL